MKCRIFVGSIFSGLGITGLYAKPPKTRAGEVPTRIFGKTGARLTVIGQGGGRLALLRTKEKASAHVRYAYGLGINYFDSAHSYWEGHAEEVYGDVLAECATKSSSRRNLAGKLEKMLKNSSISR